MDAVVVVLVVAVVVAIAVAFVVVAVVGEDERICKSERLGGTEFVVDVSLCIGLVFMVVHYFGLSAVLKG